MKNLQEKDTSSLGKVRRKFALWRSPGGKDRNKDPPTPGRKQGPPKSVKAI